MKCHLGPGVSNGLNVGATYHLEPKELCLNAQRQAARTETEKCDIRVAVLANGSEMSQSFPVEMLAYDQWPGTVVYPDSSRPL